MSASDHINPGIYPAALGCSTRAARPQPAQMLRRALVASETLADFASAFAGMAASLLLANSMHPYRLAQTAAFSLMAGFVAVLAMRSSRAYDEEGSLLHIRETERILRAGVYTALSTAPVILATVPRISKTTIAYAPLFITGLLMVQKRCFFFALRHLDEYRDGAERAVVYGAVTAERRVISSLLQSVRLGLRPVAIIDDSPGATERCVFELGYRDRASITVHAVPITPSLLIACGCNTLVIADDGLSPDKHINALQCARLANARVAFLKEPEVANEFTSRSKSIDGLRMIFDDQADVPRSMYDISKRIIDVALSSLALVVLSPVLLMIGVLIRLDSAGPVIFVQDRVGLGGRIFKILKFRSMYQDCSCYEVSPTTSRDPRLTRVGKILRRLSLDELPQFVNVLLGTMSLVGPRPEMPFIARDYSPLEQKRLQVMPGITGLWQLSADRAFPIHENLDYDLYYIRHRGIFMDLAILIHTVAFAMRAGI